MALSVPQAELSGVFLESLAYGVYLMVFNQCMLVLRKRGSQPSGYLIGTAVSLFILITAHLIIDILRCMEAFTSNEGITEIYRAWGTWKTFAKTALYIVVTLVSDAFILYRSFIIWNRSYLIAAFPFLLFISGIAILGYSLYVTSLVDPPMEGFFVIATTMYSTTLALNIICTSLIVVKILIIQKAAGPFLGDDSRVSRVVPIIVESGFVYSTCLVIMIISWTCESQVKIIVLNAIPPIIGIVFSSIIVRIGLGLSRGDSHQDTKVTSATRHRWPKHASSRHTTNSRQLYIPSFPEGGAQVSLEQTIHTRTEVIPDDVKSNISNALYYKSTSEYGV